jgi:uncharacterized protein with GYD domain
MPLYLSRFSYTPETWARLIGNPEDRRKAAQSYIESVGGKLHGFWYAFGTHDGYTLWEAPDNVSTAAVALAIGSGGALSSLGCMVAVQVADLPASEPESELRHAGRSSFCDGRTQTGSRLAAGVAPPLDHFLRRTPARQEVHAIWN